MNASLGHLMSWNSSRKSVDCKVESHFDCEHSSQSDFAFVFGRREPGVIEVAEGFPSKIVSEVFLAKKTNLLSSD